MDASPASLPARIALVVDDEPVVRLVVRRYLDRAGWTVIEADTGERALELLAAGAMPDFVLCDLNLPGLSGATLCRRISERHPALAARLVLTSGDLTKATAELERVSLDCPILGKPFTLVDLQRVVDMVTSAA